MILGTRQSIGWKKSLFTSLGCQKKSLFTKLGCGKKSLFIRLGCQKKPLFTSLGCRKKYLFPSLGCQKNDIIWKSLRGIIVNGVPWEVPRTKSLGTCGPSGFSLGTPLDTPFTMIPPQLFQIMSHHTGPALSLFTGPSTQHSGSLHHCFGSHSLREVELACS